MPALAPVASTLASRASTHTSRIARARPRSPRASSVVSRATMTTPRDDAAHDWAWPSDTSVGAHVVGESFRVKGLHLTNHEIAAPLTTDADSPLIRVFVREVVAASRGKVTQTERRALPAVLFLQGGPGFECARPCEEGGWLGELVKEHRVFLMDQRGTGMSSAELARARFEDDGETLVEPDVNVASGSDASAASRWAKLLKCFRADAIVRDAELFRKRALGDDVKWTLLGQSFGGFCITTYLSFAPEGVKEALYTGGLPPLIDEEASALGAYTKLLNRVKTQNEKFHARFPGDNERARYLARHIQEVDTPLPGGGSLSATHLRALGFSNLGTAHGMERLHYILENVRVEPTGTAPLSKKLLIEIENAYRHFETNPLYAILHESIYCSGANAYGAADEALRNRTEFDTMADPSKQFLFTGEMVYESFFEDIHSLRPYRDIWRELVREKEWTKLYDSKRLGTNENIPVACASYVEDMFVDFDLAAETAAKISGARVWSTSEYMHSGIRENGAVIVNKLLSYTRDEDPIR